MQPLLLDALLVVLITMHSYSKIAAFYGVPEMNIAKISQNSALNNNTETSSAGAAAWLHSTELIVAPKILRQYLSVRKKLIPYLTMSGLVNFMRSIVAN